MKLVLSVLLLTVVAAMAHAAPVPAQNPERWEAAAILKYPALREQGSPLNKQFLAVVAAKRQSEPAFFNQPDWPLRAADLAVEEIKNAEAVAKEKAMADEQAAKAKGEAEAKKVKAGIATKQASTPDQRGEMDRKDAKQESDRSKTGWIAKFGAGEAVELAGLIDQQIEARLSKEGVRAAALADDAEFVRRIYLDLHGEVPPLEQVKRFLADPRPDKRARLIDSLLADARYGQYLADIWQGYLMSPLADDPTRRAERFRDWLAGQFNTRPWNEIATELIAGTGTMEDNPAVTYLIEGRLPRAVPDLTDLTSRYFLGIRLNCAQCHDHPFVKWKQQEFWGMAAFFTQIQTPKRAKQVYEKGVIDDPTLTLANLKDAGVPDGFIQSAPTFLGGKALSPGSGTITHRAALAEWMTTPENRWFARAAANRTWWRLMGRAIVRPVDDMSEANAPSHPQVLELLTRKFVESGFDLKFLTRAIVLSRAYQRTSQTSQGGASPDQQAELFGRMSIKVLSAGQLYDSLETISGPAARVTGIDAREGARWEFTQFFGDNGDPEPTAYRRGIPHLLRQMNSGQFTGSGFDGLVARLNSPASRPLEETVSDLFLTILSRPPTGNEVRMAKPYVNQSGSAAGGLRELAWVLVMTSEFSLNH